MSTEPLVDEQLAQPVQEAMAKVKGGPMVVGDINSEFIQLIGPDVECTLTLTFPSESERRKAMRKSAAAKIMGKNGIVKMDVLEDDQMEREKEEAEKEAEKEREYERERYVEVVKPYLAERAAESAYLAKLNE